jgi:formate dehydrogenase major subunit
LDIARRLGHDWQYDSVEAVWDELRSLSPMHAGMSYRRLEELGGIQWPCYREDALEPSYLHSRLWSEDPAARGRLAPFSVVVDEGPVDALDDEYPFRLTTGRRLDSYNTGVQSGGFASPLRFGETIDLSPADADRLDIADGERVQVSSRRGVLVAPARIDPGLRPGLVFMTMHFPDDIETNVLTIDAVDPQSGTAEFKASAVRIDKIDQLDTLAPARAAGA